MNFPWIIYALIEITNICIFQENQLIYICQRIRNFLKLFSRKTGVWAIFTDFLCLHNIFIYLKFFWRKEIFVLKVIFALSSLFYYTVRVKLANFINVDFASYQSISLIFIWQGLSVVRELGCTDTSPGCGYNGNCEDKVSNYFS